jgi:hypothetical protein
VLKLEADDIEAVAEKIAILYHLGKYDEAWKVYQQTKNLEGNPVAQEYSKMLKEKLNK